MSSTSYKRIRAFRAVVWAYYKKSGRHDLPWRDLSIDTKGRLDPYKILVSEVMLQQTQVARVIEKYRSFLKKFSTPEALSRAQLAAVLREWNGLGYNRRAKYLHDAARMIAGRYEGNITEALKHPLPGVGPYTKAAVRVFAFNDPSALIETNIRTVYFHHFFELRTYEVLLTDREIMILAQQVAMGQDPRSWHWALMDYGAHLKRNGVRNNYRSAHYTKQPKFEGSVRQVRGKILRELRDGSADPRLLRRRLEISRGDASRDDLRERLDKALMGLEKDGLIKNEKGKWRIA